MPVLPARHVSQSIARSPEDVYAYASDPHHLAKWAAGLAGEVRFEGEELVASGPLGDVHVRFAEKNELGVLDHVVTLPDGTKVLNPVRVVPNGDGSEVVFTVLQRAGTSDADFERDVAAVAKDLRMLKTLLER
jgi:hypothetical protein